MSGRWFRSLSLGVAQHHMHEVPQATFASLASLRSSQIECAALAIPSPRPRTAVWGHASYAAPAQLWLYAPQRALSRAANATFKAAVDLEPPAATTGSTPAKPAPRKRGRKKKAEQEVQPAVSSNEEAPVLPVVDLAASVPQGGEWGSVKRWVVFSDLHVSHKTVDVACQVLRRVREEAVARDAGVLFLGKYHSNELFRLQTLMCIAFPSSVRIA